MQTITRSFILILWMQILTSVRSEDCTLQQFMNGQMYDSNFDISDLEASYPVGQQLKVNCKIGYSGFFKLICTNIGWKHIGKKCEPKPCGHPGEAAFADFALESADDFVFGSKVVYTCHNGYQMISRINYRNCLAGGWDGVVPTCEAIQCPEVHVENNVQIIGQSNEATYGNVVRFVCKFNYEVLLGSPETYCNEKGEWTSLPPKCEEIKCLKPAVENGIVISNTKVYKENEFLNFECNPGFKHTDNMLSKCIKVGVRAEWTPAPRCEQITCKLSLPPVSGTSYRPNHISTFPPGETMTVTCGDRYWIVDHLTTSVTTKCKNDGEWSIRPTCREVICRIEHGQRTHTWDSWWKNAIKLDETLGYQCNEGYKKPDGFNRARCTREGLKPNPLCQEIQCTRKYIPNTELLNEKDKYRFKETAYYKCTDGYKGQFSLYCGRHGEWSGNSECDEVTCGIEHGQHTHTWDSWWKSTIKLDETLGYQCNKGYKKPDGYDRARCTREGLKPNPLCQAQCTKLKINKAHITRNDKESYIHNDRVEFMCDNKDGQAFEVVCENGIWTGIQNCSGCIVPKITNGFAKSTLNEMYYTCNEGYKLITEGWWAQSKCDEGQWLGLGSCIDESHCGPVPPIPNGEVTSPQPSYENNAQIPIECKKGYETKIPHLTCKKGVWQPNDTALNSICTYAAKPCSAPAKVDNAVILTEFQNIYLSGSEVIYVCRRDYTGQKTEIRCTEGKWEKTTLNCTGTFNLSFH